MSVENLRSRWARNESVLGAFVATPSPLAVETLAHLGYDFLVLDTEHGFLGMESLVGLMQAVTGTSTAALVRIRRGALHTVGPMFDIGAAGVIMPMVESAEEARQCAAACRYPPGGTRGWGPLRASLVRPGTTEEVNDSVLCIPMIESVAGVAGADEICAVPGVDAILVGHGDLALSMGLTLGTRWPALQEAMDSVLAACTRNGLPCATFVHDAEAAGKAHASGYRMIALGTDFGFLRAGAATALTAARSVTTD